MKELAYNQARTLCLLDIAKYKRRFHNNITDKNKF